jgi:hypothetical protein
MNAAAWLLAQRDRSIAEHERHHAMAVVAVLLAATLLLTLTTPAHEKTGRARRAATHAPSRGAVDQGVPSGEAGSISQAVVRAARVFLAGYLAYAYGHATASEIEDATPMLIALLAAHPPRLTPGMRDMQPRVIELRSAPASLGAIGVRAIVNDGGLIDYPVQLLIEIHEQRPLVDALEPR